MDEILHDPNVRRLSAYRTIQTEADRRRQSRNQAIKDWMGRFMSTVTQAKERFAT